MTIRVADSMVFYNSLNDAIKARIRLLDAQERLTSGMKVSKPSDDPAAYARSRRMDKIVRNNDKFRENIERGRAYLQSMEGALGQGQSILERVKELAVQMANGTLDAQDRAAAAQEMEQLHSAMLDVANTRFADEYVFSGTLSDVQTYDSTGTYHGNTTERNLEISMGYTVPITLRGDRIFEGTVNVFQVLEDLTNALNANDQNTVFSLIDDVDQARDQFIDARARIGSYLNAMDITNHLLDDLGFEAESEKSRLIDTDVTESTADFTRGTQALQATLTAISKTMEITLLNRM